MIETLIWQFQGETARSEAFYLVGGCLPPLSKYVYTVIYSLNWIISRGFGVEIGKKSLKPPNCCVFFWTDRLQSYETWTTQAQLKSTTIAKLKHAVATCISLGRVHLSRKYSNFCWPYRSNYKHQEFTLSSAAICPRVNLNKIGDRISTCFLGDDNDPKKINLKHHLSVHHDSIPIYFKFPTPFVYLWQQ